MNIKHLLSYIVRGTSSEALQKLLDVTPLQPLNFNFWAAAQTQVYMKKTAYIESLIQCTQTFAE